MRYVALVLASACLTSCATSVPRLAKPWTVEGRVVAEADGKPIALKGIDLLRFERRGLFWGGDFPFVSLQTDENGKFSVSGVAAGRFTVASKCPAVFGGLFEPLGELNAGQHIERTFIFHTCPANAR